MKRQVADRLFLTSVSMTLVATAFGEPASLIYKLVNSGGAYALACMAFLFTASLVALFDTVVNDMLPERYAFKTALGRRCGIWMGLAMTFDGICFVAVKNGYTWWSAIFFFLFSIRLAGVAFLDLYYEYRDVVRDPATALSDKLPGAISDE